MCGACGIPETRSRLGLCAQPLLRVPRPLLTPAPVPFLPTLLGNIPQGSPGPGHPLPGVSSSPSRPVQRAGHAVRRPRNRLPSAEHAWCSPCLDKSGQQRGSYPGAQPNAYSPGGQPSRSIRKPLSAHGRPVPGVVSAVRSSTAGPGLGAFGGCAPLLPTMPPQAGAKRVSPPQRRRVKVTCGNSPSSHRWGLEDPRLNPRHVDPQPLSPSPKLHRPQAHRPG